MSTYRLQLGPGLTFLHAAELVPYLAELGITELYLSPILACRAGSTHGYDVSDHGRLNEALGGEPAFQALAERARSHGMGILIDFVPNHMAADPAGNPWWRSVLENGPSSPYAGYFDIDWDPVKAELKGKLLLPILGDQYGVELEAGAIRLELAAGGFALRVYDQLLPLNPRQTRILLSQDQEELEQDLPSGDPDLTEYLSILFHLEHMPAYTATEPRLVDERQREKEVATSRLMALIARSDRIRSHVERLVQRFNGRPGEPVSFDLLHQLLEAQAYRLASWRTAMHEINYRRFFDVNELAGIRMERPEVFEAAHALVGRLVEEGRITGLRLDHVDGLFEPASYLQSLASRLEHDGPTWLVVEKILSENEPLDPSWPVHGTTGYDFLNQVNRVLIDPLGAESLQRVYAGFTGDHRPFADVAYQSKKTIIATSMAAELNVLAAELNRMSEGNRRMRDFTLDSLQEALEEVVACFPVYRTYVGPDGWTARDREVVDHAIAEALRRNPALEPTIFGFIRSMLLPEPGQQGASYTKRLRFALKFQQYTAPVLAKGVEDTAFYRQAALISATEVGGGPHAGADPVGAFHEAALARLREWPYAMLATATHDTKRGEDSRTRLNVLSETPERWRAMLGRWTRTTAPVRPIVEGVRAPDPADEHLYYQALLGAWPPEGDGPPDPAFVERMQGFMQKAMREAKTHTSWLNPNSEYESAVLDFVRDTLVGPVADAFRRSFVPFARRLAWFGMLNSISQLLLKVTTPGVPDFYQGTELWDLSLVDPDNRRPVDFGRRRSLLAELEVSGRPDQETDRERLAQLLVAWPDGRIKLLMTAVALRLRRQRPGLFLEGEYIPLQPTGPATEHVVALGRKWREEAVVVVVPRLLARLLGDRTDEAPPLGPAVWGGTRIPLPAGWGGRFRHVVTGETVRAGRNGLELEEVFGVWPWGLLVPVSED